MAQVVFDVDLDDATIENLQELRWRRKLVVITQLNDMAQTLSALEEIGAVTTDEKEAYAPKVRGELEAKLVQLESRLADPSIFYDDEIEYYLDLVNTLPG